MLTINVPATEYYDEAKQEFFSNEEYVLTFEHSLVALSKWESIWEKPFLSKDKKTNEETYSYLEAMCVTLDVPSVIFSQLSSEAVNAINKNMTSKMTATWFKEEKRDSRSAEIVTSEVIYYWMITLKIPLECETWHLNRLLTLIQVLNQKNSPKKKIGRREAMAQQKALNDARLTKLNTSG